MNAVEIAPVVKTIDVARSAIDAFRLFTQEMGAWWPLETHTRANRAAGERAVRVVVEPRVGGRVYEVLVDGRELDWGEVEIHDPGAHFAMRWRVGAPHEEGTRVSVRFEALAPQSCRVTLTHENWERMGADGAKMRDAYNQGWVEVFERRFRTHASADLDRRSKCYGQ